MKLDKIHRYPRPRMKISALSILLADASRIQTSRARIPTTKNSSRAINEVQRQTLLFISSEILGRVYLQNLGIIALWGRHFLLVVIKPPVIIEMARISISKFGQFFELQSPLFLSLKFIWRYNVQTSNCFRPRWERICNCLKLIVEFKEVIAMEMRV